MPRIRCPQCGAVTDTRAPGEYPFCVGCGGNLAKCGCCRRFDDRTQACTEPGIGAVFEVNAEAAPPCGHHVPRPGMVVPETWRRVLVPVVLAGALFVLGYGLWMLREPSLPPLARTDELALSVAVADEARVGQPLAVKLQIVNRSGRRVEEIRVELPRSFVREFAPQRTDSRTGYWQDFGQWRGLMLPPLKPGERRPVEFTLVPQRPGSFRMKVRLLSELGVHDVPDRTPIRVKAASAD